MIDQLLELLSEKERKLYEKYLATQSNPDAPKIVPNYITFNALTVLKLVGLIKSGVPQTQVTERMNVGLEYLQARKARNEAYQTMLELESKLDDLDDSDDSDDEAPKKTSKVTLQR